MINSISRKSLEHKVIFLLDTPRCVHCQAGQYMIRPIQLDRETVQEINKADTKRLLSATTMMEQWKCVRPLSVRVEWNPRAIHVNNELAILPSTSKSLQLSCAILRCIETHIITLWIHNKSDRFELYYIRLYANKFLRHYDRYILFYSNALQPPKW